jgi:hypothetical protein
MIFNPMTRSTKRMGVEVSHFVVSPIEERDAVEVATGRVADFTGLSLRFRDDISKVTAHERIQ